MNNTKVARIRQKVTMLKQQFLQSDSGLFDQALGEQEIEAVMRELVEPHRERIYPPLDTLRLFVGQVLSADRACQDVVGRRLSERVAQGQTLSALNTSAYCEARQRLPTTLPVALSTMIGERLEAMTPAAWRWQGRCVKLFDGTTVTMPDTPSNQETYPQSREQKPGLGFPIARIGALIGLSSGAMLAYQVAACKGKGTGEQSLLANMLDQLNKSDILLADALLATWWIIHGTMNRGADVVMAQHGVRITDFTRGQRLGKNDHVVQWPRPPKPKAMSAEKYAGYPEFITMREVKVNGRILVTTLLDPAFASVQSLGALYAMRWNIEVDFRTIKAGNGCVALQITADGGQRDCGVFPGLQPGAMGDGESGIAGGRIAKDVELCRSQAIAGNIRRSTSPNIGRSSPHFDCHSDGLYGDIAIATSP